MKRFYRGTISQVALCITLLHYPSKPLLWAQQTLLPAGKPNYAAERTERANDLSRPYGWMSLVALKAVHSGIITIGSAKDNSLVLDHAPAYLLQLENKNGRVMVRTADPSVKYHDKSVTSATEISIGENDEAALSSGSLRLWVIKRGDELFLRVKDSESQALKQFHNLRWYPPDDRYRISAQWVPDPVAHHLQVVNKLGQLSETTIPGHLEFELDRRKLTLIPLEATTESLWFVFRDETYRTDTDQGGRFLTVKTPVTGLEQKGTLQLDFNEAINPPFAYSPFATCPLASKENRLTVAIAAGEKRYEP